MQGFVGLFWEGFFEGSRMKEIFYLFYFAILLISSHFIDLIGLIVPDGGGFVGD